MHADVSFRFGRPKNLQGTPYQNETQPLGNGGFGFKVSPGFGCRLPVVLRMWGLTTNDACCACVQPVSLNTGDVLVITYNNRCVKQSSVQVVVAGWAGLLDPGSCVVLLEKFKNIATMWGDDNWKHSSATASQASLIQTSKATALCSPHLLYLGTTPGDKSLGLAAPYGPGGSVHNVPFNTTGEQDQYLVIHLFATLRLLEQNVADNNACVDLLGGERQVLPVRLPDGSHGGKPGTLLAD